MSYFSFLYNIGVQPNDSPALVKHINWHNRLAVLIMLVLSLGCLLLSFFIPIKYVLPIELAILSKCFILGLNALRHNKYVHHLQSFTHLLIGFVIVGTFGKDTDLHYLLLLVILYTAVVRIALNMDGVYFLIGIALFAFSVLWYLDSSFYKISFFSSKEISDFQNILVLLVVALLSIISSQFVNNANKNAENLLKAEQLLHEKLQELEKTTQELDRFVYSVSHDLRAPLASALGLVDLCRKDFDSRVSYLNMQEKSLKKLDSFIQDVLTYSQNANLSAKIEKVDFKNLVNEIFDSLRYQEDTRKIVLNCYSKQSTAFYADRFRLQIVLSNLIGNAIRYHNPQQTNPYVIVNVEVSRKKSIIQVKDNGIGISPSHLPNIFEMFYRAHIKSLGSGLGLYIVKEAVKKMNGEVQVISTLNEGTTFIVEIPNSY